MSFRYFAVIKETHEEFTEYFKKENNISDIDKEKAQVFRLEGENFTVKSFNDLVAFDKSNDTYSISQLPYTDTLDDSISFFREFVSLPEVVRNKVVIFTDGACDIEKDPEWDVNWAGPKAGLGVYVGVPNFKNHISANVNQEASLLRKEAKTVIEHAEAEALLAALILIRGYNYKWIVIKTDCLNVLHSIINYISNIINKVSSDDHSHLTETFDKFFHVLFNGLPSGVNVILQKVKSHIGIIGNENADHLAKNGKKMQYTMLEMIEFIESLIPKTRETKEIDRDEWIFQSKGGKKNQGPSNKAATPVLNNDVDSNKRRYRFWITYLPHCIENSQIESSVVDSKVSDRPKNSDFDKRDVLVETNYPTYLSLIAKKYITFEGGNGCPISLRCTVVPYVLQCDRCLQMGHFGTRCRSNLKLCGICSESGHQHSACQMKRNVCYNCRQARLPAGHSTFSNECPQRLAEIEKERTRARKEVLRWTSRAAG